jgi:DNA (cytosine-5)-methyltransferase 1
MADSLTVGSLFSGIGGLDLGLERAGMTVVWQAEIEPYCCEVLAKHWPGVPNLGDVTKIEGSPIDVLCGGFPCQPVSEAGKRKGTDDERWLWSYYANAIRCLRPRVSIMENVAGLLTANGGSAFGSILSDLAEIGCDAEWAVFPASAVGAPQNRPRIWILSYPEGFCGAARDLLGESQDGSAPPSVRRLLGPSVALPGEADDPWAGGEPDVDCLVDGTPAILAKLRALGNAVVPQCAEFVGRCITERLVD